MDVARRELGVDLAQHLIERLAAGRLAGAVAHDDDRVVLAGLGQRHVDRVGAAIARQRVAERQVADDADDRAPLRRVADRGQAQPLADRRAARPVASGERSADQRHRRLRSIVGRHEQAARDRPDADRHLAERGDDVRGRQRPAAGA